MICNTIFNVCGMLLSMPVKGQLFSTLEVSNFVVKANTPGLLNHFSHLNIENNTSKGLGKKEETISKIFNIIRLRVGL